MSIVRWWLALLMPDLRERLHNKGVCMLMPEVCFLDTCSTYRLQKRTASRVGVSYVGPAEWNAQQ